MELRLRSEVLLVMGRNFLNTVNNNKMDTKQKTYEISTLEQLCNVVNDNNIELLLLDFAQWLCYYNEMIKKARVEHKKETKGLSNTEIAKANFVWTDDGENKISGVTVKNTKTGEVVSKKFD
jgi:hypothetical protein